ncbi:MAG: hypothetical protein Q7T77_04690 [Sulfuricurvum sp.]|nr:hypothetical protein [Sulfuricurvum sp.]
MLKPIAPSFDFGGSFIETIPQPKPKVTIQLTTADFSKVPQMSYQVVLDKMKEMIQKGVLKQSDLYHRIFLSYQPIISINSNPDVRLIPGEYRVDFVHWSDSAVYLDIYNNGGKDLPTDEFLNLCDAAGAYTKRAWMSYADNPKITPTYLMEFFNIQSRVRPAYIGSGTKQECENLINIIVEWNRNHIRSLQDMTSDNTLNFIRIHRRKGEIETTKCMNGDCIGVIFARETNF